MVGLDNFSKYGRLQKSYDSHPRYKLVEGDAKDVALMKELLSDCDHFVAAAAMIGGISYFHEFAYDLLAENERIIASSFDAAIWAHKERKLKRSSCSPPAWFSRARPNTPRRKERSGAARRLARPTASRKLAVEYFVQGAYEQYKLPYTIVRPFNCVGIGEKRALSDRDIMSGNVRLAMSHVVPDLVQKLVKGQDPLHILGDGKQVRHYTYGGDLARGIRVCVEHPAALNQDFNLSTPVRTTVLELAELIWKKIHGSGKPFRYVSDPAYEYDVQERAPAVGKARDLLGFEATTPLSDILDEVIPWIAEQVEIGQM